MRLVIDTNVFISTLISSASLPADLIVSWRAGRFDILTSTEQLDARVRVTRDPRIRERLAPSLAGRLINDVRDVAITAVNLPAVSACRDPPDNYLRAIALAGRADFLLTGDKRDTLGLTRQRAPKS